ncbi:hypothetical protein [Rhizobium leguminosarum]
MDYDLGYIDLEQRILQTIDNPFGMRLSPMSEEQSVTYVFGMGNLETGAGEGIRTLDPNLGKVGEPAYQRISTGINRRQLTS